MPNQSKYDLSFQPNTYWDLRDVLTHVEAKIPGKVRKELIKIALQNGETVPSEYLKSSLSVDLKQSIGSIDPSFLGGEFLPELGENDVIIASINLKSTTSDVIVVIARLTDKGIEYRVEDEYMDSYPEGEEHYKVQPNFSKEPLSFKELINLIDNAGEGGGLIDSAKNFYPEEPEEYYDFATAESAFYPQLGGWYDESNNEWLENKLELKRQEERVSRLVDFWFNSSMNKRRVDEAKSRSMSLEEYKEWYRSEIVEQVKKELEEQKEKERISQKIEREEHRIDILEAKSRSMSLDKYKEWFRSKVEDVYQKAFWPGSYVSGMWSSIVRSKKEREIRSYIWNYFYTNRKFPSGKHSLKAMVWGKKVHQFEVKF